MNKIDLCSTIRLHKTEMTNSITIRMIYEVLLKFYMQKWRWKDEFYNERVRASTTSTPYLGKTRTRFVINQVKKYPRWNNLALIRGDVQHKMHIFSWLGIQLLSLEDQSHRLTNTFICCIIYLRTNCYIHLFECMYITYMNTCTVAFTEMIEFLTHWSGSNSI